MSPQFQGPTCAYKSGKCGNPRAIKVNGDPHSLCSYHRDRQNAHQRKSDRKTRHAKKHMEAREPHVDTRPALEFPPDSFLYKSEDGLRHPLVTLDNTHTLDQERLPSQHSYRLPPIRFVLQAHFVPAMVPRHQIPAVHLHAEV
ncbi:hypothetical protein H310_08635 [Aphanomyces invadans]|uniref:Uncharacterized protein n=1 Tax=Aphanomyces invadans TaxID=157072 RepID=A0A024TYT7_9STRA|nr:hypothetical protein H310_08635 [Aphanomyces invadans]ETV98497.1 hypothetical protein H310_08635 [Aphanomyces invadans]|eukprot:XP_008872694.1 hypothetical protein H310_08635 [Aphanomyces invadans]